MPLGASCLARVFIRASEPALDEPYPGAEVISPIFPAMDETFTIVPDRCRFMVPTTALQQLNVPFRLTAITRSQSSSPTVSIVPRRMIPALLTSRSIRPKVPRTSSTIAFTSGLFSISQTTGRICPPRFSASTCRLRRASRSTSTGTTFAPSSISANAMLRPMPFAAPVTTAT